MIKPNPELADLMKMHKDKQAEGQRTEMPVQPTQEIKDAVRMKSSGMKY